MFSKGLESFRIFDVDGKGKFDVQDIKRIAKDINEPITDKEVQLIIDEFDCDGNGEIAIDWNWTSSKSH